MAKPIQILLISGSLREGSTNSALLKTATMIGTKELAPVFYRGVNSLPHFNPDDDLEGEPVSSPVADLRAEIWASGALLFCTPEYAGALPGSFKNLLEWTVGDASLYGKPVGWINVSGSAAPSGGRDAHESLRKVLGYVGASIVEEACLEIPLNRNLVNTDGVITDPDVRQQLRTGLGALAASARNDS